jgi:hypothetical protein
MKSYLMEVDVKPPTLDCDTQVGADGAQSDGVFHALNLSRPNRDHHAVFGFQRGG